MKKRWYAARFSPTKEWEIEIKKHIYALFRHQHLEMTYTGRLIFEQQPRR